MANGIITKRSVDAALPRDKDWFLWDDYIPGFGLKITPAGGKMYVLQYRCAHPGQSNKTTARRYTIGKHGQLTPEQARRRAKELAALVTHGVDPRQQDLDLAAADEAQARADAERLQLETELAFENIAERWLEHYEYEKARRPSSVRQARLVVNRYLLPRLRGKPMPHITRMHLQPIIDAIPIRQRGMRRAVFTYASILFGWAYKRGTIDANPLASMLKPIAPKARERVLDDAELAAAWHATYTITAPFGSFFRLLILTGQRRSEVAGLEWNELDRAAATWTIPSLRAKNDVTHIVPLSDAALAELDALARQSSAEADSNTTAPAKWPKAGLVLTTTGRTPISGITKAKTALDKAIADARDGIPLAHWRIHDLRRTLATGFQRLGVRFEVTEATLNHLSGAKAGVAGIYQKHDWRSEKREALEKWAVWLEELVSRLED